MLVTLLVILAAGTALRSVQYFAATSLWSDEISIAQDIERRPLGELLGRPLDNAHVAPVGFLALVDLATVLGSGERALRLVPFLASLAALPLFVLVARRFLAGWPLLTATAAFGLNPALVWYAGNLKQYSGDVAAALLLVWLALRLLDTVRPQSGIVVGAVGALVVLISQPAVLVAFVLGCALVVIAWRDRTLLRRPVFLALAGWGFGAIAATAIALSLLSPETSEYMRRYWSGSFPPLPWKGLDQLIWLPRRLLLNFAHLLVFVDPSESFQLALVAVPATLAVAGATALFRREARTAALLIAPTIAALVAAGAHLLPFRGRLTIYATWPLLILAAAGVGAIIESTSSRRGSLRRALAVASAIAVVAPPLAVLAVQPPPFHTQEARPILAELARRWRPGDVLYVYCGGRAAIDYYGPRVGITDWVQGGCYGADFEPYRRELAKLGDAPRIWFFYTLAHPIYREPEAIREELSRGRREVDQIRDPYGNIGPNEATALLYQLDAASARAP